MPREPAHQPLKLSARELDVSSRKVLAQGHFVKNGSSSATAPGGLTCGRAVTEAMIDICVIESWTS